MARPASLAQLAVILAACALLLLKPPWIQSECRVSMSAHEYDPGWETTGRPEGSERGSEQALEMVAVWIEGKQCVDRTAEPSASYPCRVTCDSQNGVSRPAEVCARIAIPFHPCGEE